MRETDRPRVTIGEVGAPVIIGSDSFVIARVPEGATAGELVVESGEQASESWACDIGVLVADSLHPVANPAVDRFGNIFTTFSGSRGQKVPVAVYKIDLNFNVKPFINDLMNATGLAFDRAGHAVHLQPLRRHRLPGDAQRQHVACTWKAWAWPPAWRSTETRTSTWATAAARSSRSAPTARSSSSPPWSRPSRPTTWPSARTATCTSPGPPLPASTAVYRISHAGEVETFYRGLGRPQGMAFDEEGRLYVAASLAGRKGVVRIDPDRQRRAVPLRPGHRGAGVHAVARHGGGHHQRLYRVDVGIKGRPLDLDERRNHRRRLARC